MINGSHFPEEINRKIAGTVADLHFAPTNGIETNLIREGVSEANIVITGNPVIDAVRWIAAQPIPLGDYNLTERPGRWFFGTEPAGTCDRSSQGKFWRTPGANMHCDQPAGR